VIVAVPAPVGVKTPEEVIVPPVAVQATAELNVPVPSTVAAQVDVCVVKMDAGEQTTETEVIVDGAAVTVSVSVPDAFVSCVEVALIVAVPVFAGVKTPAGVIAPPLTPQVNVGLNVPVPCTVAVQVDVCVMRIEVGEQVTVTDVMVDCGAGLDGFTPESEMHPESAAKAPAADNRAANLQTNLKALRRRSFSIICAPLREF